MKKEITKIERKAFKEALKNEVSPLLIGLRNDIKQTNSALVIISDAIIKSGQIPIATTDELKNTNALLREIAEESKKKDSEDWTFEVSTQLAAKIKGEKGDDGKTIKGPRGLRGLAGKNGKTPKIGVDYLTRSEIKQIIESVRPKKGVDYRDGIDGITTIKKVEVKLSATGIRNLLESLKGKQRLKMSAIGGLEEILNELASRGGGGGIGGSGNITGSSSFITLTDAPSSYTAQALKGVRVNAAATGLEFYTISAGGSPAGNTGNVQFNNASAFGGDDYFNFNTTSKRVGVQVALADVSASLHVGGLYGDTVTVPASATATLVLDSAVDRPASYSVAQVGAPTFPVAFSFNFTYIDLPYDNGQFTTQNTGGSGFIANGQSISYTVYSYRMVGGVRVRNPNAFNLTVFYDSINDGTTPFEMDIGGWATPNGFEDGFLLFRSDNTGNYVLDIGNATTYNDTYFTANDSYVDSAYACSGATWSPAVGQYKSYGGPFYVSEYATADAADSNYGGAYFIVNATWGAVADNGFVYRSVFGNFTDVLTATSFDDYGQVVTGEPYSHFLTIAFPYFNPTLSDASWSSGQIDYFTGSSLVADGSSYDLFVWEYRINTIDNVKYFTGAGVSYGGLSDDNSSNYLTFSGVVNAGTGDGRVIELRKNGSSIGYVDIGGGTSFSSLDNTVGGAWSAPNNIGSYTGMSWSWSAYGKITSPATKFSTLHRDYSTTDNNPTGGFIWAHTLATFGNATNMKLINNGPRTAGNFYEGATATSLYQTNTGLGDTTVTPATIGFLSDGSTLNRVYRFRSTKTINGIVVYSSTYAQASVSDPADGHYYTVALTVAAVSGATFKTSRSINGAGLEYRTHSSTSFQDDTSYTWSNSDSTITPTQSIGRIGILQTLISDYTTQPAILALRNTAAGDVQNSGIAFEYSTGINAGRIAIDGSGNMRFAAYSSANFSFGGTLAGNNPCFILGGLSGNALFNVNQLNTGHFTVYSDNNTAALKVQAAHDTVYIGTDNGGGDATSALFVQGYTSGDLGLYVKGAASGNDSNGAVLFQTSAGAAGFIFSNDGRVAIGSGVSISNAWLQLKANTTSYAAINIPIGASGDPSPGAVGDLWHIGNGLFFHAIGGVKQLQMWLGSSTSGQMWYSDSSGYGAASSNIIISGSNITFTQAPLFQQGFAVSSNKDISMGGGSRYIGGIRTSYATGTASVSLNQANHSPIFVFTGSTAGRTITLPTAVSVSGIVFEIVNNSSVSVTVATTSSQTIYRIAATTTVVLQAGESLYVVSDGTNWVSSNYSIYALAATWTATQIFNADIKLGTAGNGLYVKEGSNATMGTATLSAGTVVVSTTKVTANSRIYLSVNGGTLTNIGALYISARTAGTSFTISSSNILDASTVAWIIIEPA